jgi:ABC-2 type transport system permease protein
MVVGLVTWLVAGSFQGFGVAHPLLAVGLLLLAATSFAALGFTTAVWARTFEQVNFIPTFVITPLTFLGGVFYSVEMLPPGLRAFTLANPVFYLVDGVRFGILGISDASPLAGTALVALLAVGSVAAAWAVLRSGWRLRG